MVSRKLTVVMPVYNADKFVAAAIESICAQSFREFDFFIIDDGSTDNSARIIKSYARQDDRIHFFQQHNQGLVPTLNYFMSKVTTPLIARMDADDIALPTRLEKQLAYLEANPEVGIVGCAVRYMNENLDQLIEAGQFPQTHLSILWKMLYTGGFSHPSIMLRKSVFAMAGGYDPQAKHVEDYALFLKVRNMTRFANLPDFLMVYRQNPGSVSARNKKIQLAALLLLSQNYASSFLPEMSDQTMHFLRTHTLVEPRLAPVIYKNLSELYDRFLETFSPAEPERNFIYRDLMKHLSVLSLTYKNSNFVGGIVLYVRVVTRAPWILIHTLKSKKR